MILAYSNGTNPMTNITFDGLTLDRCSNGIRNNPVSTYTITDVTVQNCKFYLDWSEKESLYIGTTPDAITFSGNLNGCVIKGNTFRDTFHAGVNLTKQNATYDPIQNVRIFDNEFIGVDCAYVRGIGTACPRSDSGGVNNIEIFRNYFYNMNVRTQIQGSNVKFHHNIIDTMRQCLINETVYGITGPVEQGISVGAAATAEVNNVEISNNIVMNCYDSAMRIQDISNAYPIDSVIVKNNIFIQGPDSATDIALRYLENLPFTGTMDIDNNVFYSPNTETTIDWDGTTHTVATAEADGTIGGYMSDNLITDPDLNADYLPLGGSDAIGNGIAPAILMDYYGRILPNAVYHIGAVWPARGCANKRGFTARSMGLYWVGLHLM